MIKHLCSHRLCKGLKKPYRLPYAGHRENIPHGGRCCGYLFPFYRLAWPIMVLFGTD